MNLGLVDPEVVLPRGCPVEFRRKALDLVEAGPPAAEVAGQLGVTAQTIYSWRKQDQAPTVACNKDYEHRVGRAYSGS